MAFLLKVHWCIKSGKEEEFKTAQKELAQVMLGHPGVLTYHVDYPEPGVSEWVELYANDETFAAHLDNVTGHAPLRTLIDSCSSINCRCWGDPSDGSRERLKAFSATYNSTGAGSFVLNPNADIASPV